MTTKTHLTSGTEFTDAELVARSLNGDREAFNAIIERYKNLVCSLAYSATGNLSKSEDVAQDTFIAAWANLRSLREPEKLRSWLCGIVRNLTRKSFRADASEPVLNAATLEDAQHAATIDATPSDQAISREEEAILWRSLERMPEIYREPLILFYREHQSIESVAAELDLTEDAVKQRLSRGRKLLQEQVERFVESALRRTAPTPAFSNAVLSALPITAPSIAAAAGSKAAAAKMGFFGIWIMPFIGVFAAMLGQFMVISDTTPRGSARLKKMGFVALVWAAVILSAWFGEGLVQSVGEHFDWNSRTRFIAEAIYWTVYLMILIPCMGMFTRIDSRQKATATPTVMKPASLASSTLGIHLAIFWPLLRQGWIAADQTGVAIIGMFIFCVSGAVFYRGRNKSGADLFQVFSNGLACSFVGIFLTLNLRADVWVAAALKVTVAEAHQIEPLWILPVLSAALVIWVLFLGKVTKRLGGTAPSR